MPVKAHRVFRKIAANIAVVLSAGVLPVANAQEAPVGVWEGELAVSADQSVDVQFTFTSNADGSMTATLSLPGQDGMQDVPVDTISFSDGALNMSVNALSGSYESRLTDGVLEGTWSQQGTSLPLNLRPYEEPSLSEADIEALSGSWRGKLRPIPGGDLEVNVVFRFERDEAGEFLAFFDSPDEGAIGIPIESVGVKDGEVMLTVPRARMEFNGALQAESIVGTWEQMGRTLELTLERGEFTAEGLAMSAEDFARLAGPWHGTVGPLNVEFLFEEEDGQYFAHMNSPDQGAANIRINELSVDGDQLTFAISAAGASFTGAMTAEGINGQWQQMGQQMALALEKGPYVPNASLSDTAKQQLQGEWHGNVNNTDLVLRFVLNADDSLTAFLDVASAGLNGAPISNVVLDDSTFSFSVMAIQASFTGALSGTEANGTWTRANNSNPIVWTKQ